MKHQTIKAIDPNRNPKVDFTGRRQSVRNAFLTISSLGLVSITSFSLNAEDASEVFELPAWTTDDFYNAIENDDAKSIQTYLSDTTRATKEFLSYYLLDYALELDRDDIAMLMVRAGAGVNTLPAVQHENEQIFEAMLKQGVEPKGASLAAERGNIPMLSKLLEHGDDELSTNGAAQHGQLEALRLLLDHGAEPEGLELAVLNGHEEVAKLLLASGANPNYLTKYPLGWEEYSFLKGNAREYLSPLHYAVLRQSTELVELLLQNGADPNVKPTTFALLQTRRFNKTPWPTVLQLAKDLETEVSTMTELLEKYGASKTVTADEDEDIQLDKALYQAAKSADRETVVKLLEEGARPPVFGQFYYTFWESKWNSKVIKSFIEAGADPNSYWGSHPYTPAAMALRHGDVENFKGLMQSGASTEAFLLKFVYMKIACIQGLNEAIEYLWNLGVAPGAWELLAPVNYGHVHTVEFLLAKGIQPNFLRHAVEKEHVPIVKMLLEAGADPNKTDKHDERSILELAEELENQEITNLLTLAGAVD